MCIPLCVGPFVNMHARWGVYSLWPFLFLHLLLVANLFLYASVFLCSEVELSCRSRCKEAVFLYHERNRNTEQWHFPLHYTRTWLLQSLEEGLLSLMVWVNKRRDQKERKWKWEQKERAQWGPPPQELDQCKRDLVWGLKAFYQRLFFYEVFGLGKERERDVRRDQRALLTNQKAEVKVHFLSHLGYSELGDSSSSLQRETIFQNLHCVALFLCMHLCPWEKWCVCRFVHMCRHLCSH